MCRRPLRICFLLWPLLATMAAADQVTLQQPAFSKDNTLVQTTNPGSQLSNGTGDIFVGLTGQASNKIRRGLIWFDTSTIPTGATVSGASLTMTRNMKVSGADQTIELHRLLQGWGQGTSCFDGATGAAATDGDATWLYTYFNASNPSTSPTWSTTGGSYLSTPSASCTGGTPYTWSCSATANQQMLADVQGWVNDPSSNFGWLMLGNEITSGSALRFYSSEASSAWPALTVTYSVPEPATAVLVLAGAVGLVALRFRRRGA
jgi:hypothetical protein